MENESRRRVRSPIQTIRFQVANMRRRLHRTELDDFEIPPFMEGVSESDWEILVSFEMRRRASLETIRKDVERRIAPPRREATWNLILAVVIILTFGGSSIAVYNLYGGWWWAATTAFAAISFIFALVFTYRIFKPEHHRPHRGDEWRYQ
ncbi:hypothetical protein [Actinomadura sp. NPDC049753]|uniref:hypothetical protein n=1 Tax=Actinomadura sp. NPDC049753 TaxID=3154739 RepID=UPI00341F8B00